jgi:hypothetical protein
MARAQSPEGEASMPAPSQPLRGSPSPVSAGEGWGAGPRFDLIRSRSNLTYAGVSTAGGVDRAAARRVVIDDLADALCQHSAWLR